MMGMLRAMTGETGARFWIDDSHGVYQLHLKTETVMDPAKREALLSASTEGKNQAARGIMGKIRDIFEQAVEARNQSPSEGLYDNWRVVSEMNRGGSVPFISGWSLNQYRSHLAKNQKDAWDELEKSVVARLADEVQVSIQGGEVELVIYKKF